MPLIDDRGRLFGRLNVVDAGVLVVFVLLIPMAYAAYVLFRPAPARILAVEPSSVPPGTTEVAVRGENLRPYLRIAVGTQGGRFLFADTTGGILRLPEQLPPGTYDITLLDTAAELMRLPGALKVEVTQETASPQLIAVGRFAPASASRPMNEFLDGLRALHRGTSPKWGDVLGVDVPEEPAGFMPNLLIPFPDLNYSARAVVRFNCVLVRDGQGNGDCRVENVPLGPSATIPLKFGDQSAYFRVEALHPVYSTTVDVVLRSYVAPDEVPLLQKWRAADEDFPALTAVTPRLLSFENAGSADEPSWTVALLRVRVPVLETPRGFLHQGQIIRVGGSFGIEQPSLLIGGRVIRVERGAASSEAAR